MRLPWRRQAAATREARMGELRRALHDLSDHENSCLGCMVSPLWPCERRAQLRRAAVKAASRL